MSMVQEDIQQRSVVLTTKTAKLTARGLAALMRAAMRRMGKNSGKPAVGKQTVKELAKGGTLEDIEISNDNIKAFEPFARKFGVSYALQRDNSEDPPKWLVYFRSKDTPSMTAAFKAFSAKVLTKGKAHPSVKAAMHRIQERIKRMVRDKTKHKDHGERDL
ncbi:transposase [Clostridia bacterium]|nr:transposase [Clostridia bacterium]